MKVTSDMHLWNVVEYVGVSMQAMEFRKLNDKFDDFNWVMVTYKKDMDTSFYTLVLENKMKLILKQGVRSNFP